jgi:hypothetical protein
MIRSRAAACRQHEATPQSIGAHVLRQVSSVPKKKKLKTHETKSQIIGAHEFWWLV